MTAQPADELNEGPQPIGRFDWERIIRRVTLPPSAKFLGFVLATYADPDGSRIRPGTERLARVMGVSVPTVKRSLAVLRSGGFIVRAKQGNRWANQADEYRLTLPVELLEMQMLGPDETATLGITSDT
ncbi:helix-turn-helix domain-containing protein [Prescottella equi]|uniref:helix-turn-helix domain-containing protein n=1 Tax=Rhodococcus hoagii TaxID=43767 RepID=UPI00384E08DA